MDPSSGRVEVVGAQTLHADRPLIREVAGPHGEEAGMIGLRPWQDGDRPLLHRANTPAMTAHLGGPETDAAVDDRHWRYLEHVRSGSAHILAILDAAGTAVGAIARWRTQWEGREILEVGWFVVPEAQGRGLASQALRLVVGDARRRPEGADRLMAFPATTNEASNALCRAAGMTLHGAQPFTFRGEDFVVNAWAVELTA